MKIKEITETELNIILKNIKNYDDYWTKEMYFSEFNNPYSKIYVLDDLSGMFILRDGLDETFLMNIIVDKSLRGKGLGKELLKEFVKIAKSDRILLEVAESNKIAIKMYKAFGFKEVSTRKNYYNKETAIIMEYNRL